MRSTVFREDLVIQVLNAETQSGYTDRFDSIEFLFCQGAGFTFKSDLFSGIPRHYPLHAIDERSQVFDADIGRRSATEIDEP